MRIVGEGRNLGDAEDKLFVRQGSRVGGKCLRLTLRLGARARRIRAVEVWEGREVGRVRGLAIAPVGKLGRLRLWRAVLEAALNFAVLGVGRERVRVDRLGAGGRHHDEEGKGLCKDAYVLHSSHDTAGSCAYSSCLSKSTHKSSVWHQLDA